MRYGTRTHCKKRWTIQGQRPVCKVRLGYEWGYLYTAICPFCGTSFAMFFTHLDKDCFRQFMKEFEEHIAEEHPGKKVLLIGDGATAHTSQQWEEYQNIDWVKQPTACPEINPVERFFQELRKHTSNRVFKDKQEVENIIENLVKGYMDNPNQITRLTLFPYIKSSENYLF